MRITRAVILAAGSGSRLGASTTGRLEPLLDVAGRPLIDRQLEALADCGVSDVTVVTGYGDGPLRAHIGGRARIVRNERYRETGSLYSLWLAAEHLKGGSFVLDGDIVLCPLLLDRLKWHPAPDALLFDRSTRGLAGMKVHLAGRYLVDMSTRMPAGLVSGENVGVLKFGEEGVLRLQEMLERLVSAGETGEGVSRAVVEIAQRWPIVAVDAYGLPWTEIDCANDLACANRAIAPAIGISHARDGGCGTPALDVVRRRSGRTDLPANAGGAAVRPCALAGACGFDRVRR